MSVSVIAPLELYPWALHQKSPEITSIAKNVRHLAKSTLLPGLSVNMSHLLSIDFKSAPFYLLFLNLTPLVFCLLLLYDVTLLKVFSPAAWVML